MSSNKPDRGEARAANAAATTLPGAIQKAAPLVLAAVLGGLVAGAGWLWWHYGAAVFSEIAVAALAICF